MENQTPYPSFTNYLTYHPDRRDLGHASRVRTDNSTKGGPFQNYNLTGVISNTAQTINGMTIHPGDLVLNGTVTNASGHPEPPDHPGYEGEPELHSRSTGPIPLTRSAPPVQTSNKVVEKAVADYFSGLNFGFIGSTAPNPNAPGQTIGKPRPPGPGTVTSRMGAGRSRCR